MLWRKDCSRSRSSITPPTCSGKSGSSCEKTFKLFSRLARARITGATSWQVGQSRLAKTAKELSLIAVVPLQVIQYPTGVNDIGSAETARVPLGEAKGEAVAKSQRFPALIQARQHP